MPVRVCGKGRNPIRIIRYIDIFIDIIYCALERIICVAVCDFYIGAGFGQCHRIFRLFALYLDICHGLRCARAGCLVLNIGLLVSVLPNGDAVFIADGVACTDDRCLLLRQRVCGNRQRIAVTGNIKACLLKIEQIQHAVGIGNGGLIFAIHELQSDFLCIAAVAAFACKGRDDFRPQKTIFKFCVVTAYNRTVICQICHALNIGIDAGTPRPVCPVYGNIAFGRQPNKVLCDHRLCGRIAVPIIFTERVCRVVAISDNAAHSFGHTEIIPLHISTVIDSAFTMLQTVGRITYTVSVDVIQWKFAKVIKII